MSLEVLGRDPARDAYRIRSGSGRVAWCPECLMETLRPGERPSHQEAYEWIAAHRGKLSEAIDLRAAGRIPRAPFDLVTLCEETKNAH